MTCAIMHIEKKLDALGLTLMDLDRAYRANASGARFVSHLAVGNLLYLSGTTPVRDGQPHLLGVVGADLSLAQGYEAARYALLSSLAAIKYALGDLDRVAQAVQLIGFVNSAPGFHDQPRVINGATDLLVELTATGAGPPAPPSAARGWPSATRWRSCSRCCSAARAPPHPWRGITT